jgi:hypothetical protein
MRKLIVALIVLISAGVASAQEATITTPVTRTSEAKYTIAEFHVVVSPLAAQVEVAVKDSGNVEIRRITAKVPDPTHAGASVAGLNTAMMTIRATETGTDLRKQQFRILGYLSDQGYLSGVTLVP